MQKVDGFAVPAAKASREPIAKRPQSAPAKSLFLRLPFEQQAQRCVIIDAERLFKVDNGLVKCIIRYQGLCLLNSPAQEVLTTVFGLFLAGELEQLFHLLGGYAFLLTHLEKMHGIGKLPPSSAERASDKISSRLASTVCCMSRFVSSLPDFSSRSSPWKTNAGMRTISSASRGPALWQACTVSSTN